MRNISYLIAMVITGVITLIMFFSLISNKKQKSQIKTFFLACLFTIFIWIFSLCSQIIFQNSSVSPILFEGFASFGACFIPIAILFLGLTFTRTKIKFKLSYLLLFIIPIITTIIMFTNDYHHLFYQKYSANLNETVIGPYAIVHSVYSYGLLLIGFIYLLTYSVKNSGFFSKQSVIILIGCLVPLIVNVLGSFGIVPMTVYVTPISFAFFLFSCAIAIFKFQFLSVTPIALQRIVDRMSDLYLVINDNFRIIDFNKPFIESIHTTSNNLRNRNIFNLLVESSDLFIDDTELKKAFQTVKSNPSKTIVLEKHSEKFKKFFNIEISSIFSDRSFLGILILFKDVTQHMLDLQTIKNSQDILIERERLASLGQMIGGIAHNLKTPIMSISGAAEGLSDLIKEYDNSIDDPEVTKQDHHDISHDMSVWVEKIKDYTGYMSDVITAVKGQAVSLSDEEAVSFTLEELVKRVNILMKHELKNAICYLNVSMKVDPSTELNGNINSLVQVINNMISNSIQSYNGIPEKNIDMILYQKDNHIIIEVKDYGPRITK